MNDFANGCVLTSVLCKLFCLNVGTHSRAKKLSLPPNPQMGAYTFVAYSDEINAPTVVSSQPFCET